MGGCGVFLFVLLMIGIFQLLRWGFRLLFNLPSGTPIRAEAMSVSVGDSPPLARSKIHGCDVLVRVEWDRRLGLRYTRAVVDLRGKSPGTLKIAPPGWASQVARMFGNQDIIIGDAAFDDHFIIMANPESLAHRLFSPERRARMIASIRKIGRSWAPFIDLTRESLSVGVIAEVHAQRAILDLLDTAREIVEALLEAQHTTGILWVDDGSAEVGQCQVCGSDLVSEIVSCATCKTPHHEECWQYTGECSTYACGEKSYIKEGKRLRAPERRQTPDEWLREEVARDRRETGEFRVPMRSFPEVDAMLRRFERRQQERNRG